MDIRIIEVKSKKEMKEFINFPKRLYMDDKNFVFEPVKFQLELLSDKNSFFEHSEAGFYIAKSNDKIIGRIASITNTVHNKIYHEKTGFFGLFETIENYQVAKMLLDTVVEKHLQNGFDKILGPTNLTTNDSCGVLISGFESPPVVMMPYNKAFYNDFLLQYGFSKEMDLSSYFIDDHILTSSPIIRIVNRVNLQLAVSGITVRTINYKNLEQEIIQFREVYNASNRSNWGFIPLSENEFRKTALQFRQFVPEKLILIVEKDRQQIGFVVALPDLNQVFMQIRSGKLFPFGFLKYLWYKRRISNSRILILGVLDEYRNKGIDLILYKKIQENLASLGIYHGEACYVMENNLRMNSIMEKIGGLCVKKYRIYKFEKPA